MGTGKTDDSSDKGEHQERIQGRGVLDATHDVIQGAECHDARELLIQKQAEGKALFP